MKPEQKAKELVDRFKDKFFMEYPDVVSIKSRECALIAVNEILLVANSIEVAEYWLDVEKEINKL